LLVQPLFSAQSFWNYTEVCHLVGAKHPAAPLGLLTVAALLPQHWNFKLVDENVRPLTDHDLDWADVVLVTGMLTQHRGMVEVIHRAHEHGKPVVIGGPDATSQPEVYAEADFLVQGEGEVTIPLFLADLAKNVATGRYRSSLRADMSQAVVPRFDLICPRDYVMIGIQFSRGCPYNCEFCDIIELFGRRPRTKTPAQIVAELEHLYRLGHRGHVDFVDDNLIGNKGELVPVLEAVRDWSKQHSHPFYFSTEASINLAREAELLQLMRETDFRYIFVGIESPDDDALIEAQKTQNRNVPVVEAVRTLAAYGMIVNAGFILGFDSETRETADHMADLIQRAGICMAMLGMLCALPNTQLARRLTRESRLFAVERVYALSTTDIDQTTTGLNFATRRPRAEILRDQVKVLQRVYDPQTYYRRLQLTISHLVPAHQHRPGFRAVLRGAWAFLKGSAKITSDRRTARLYWKTLLWVLLRNPQAVDEAVSLAAIYTHFSKQSEFAAHALEQEAAHVDEYGEDAYNQLMRGALAAGIEKAGAAS